VLHRFYTDEWPRSRVATLSRLVDQTAEAGDAVARVIILNAAQHLAALTGSVRHQLWAPGDEVHVVYIGGAFRSRLLLERYRMLVELEPGSSCGVPVYSPAAGALIEAYRGAGLQPKLTNVPEMKS
jgi:N-acetylglucosamine kinase-like BadF-type ATPase